MEENKNKQIILKVNSTPKIKIKFTLKISEKIKKKQKKPLRVIHHTKMIFFAQISKQVLSHHFDKKHNHFIFQKLLYIAPKTKL